MPFVTSVVNTYASWRAEFAAEVCPSSATLEIDEVASVDVTASTKNMSNLRSVKKTAALSQAAS